MKVSNLFLWCSAVVLVVGLPSGQSRSQLVTAVTDPVTELQNMQNANEDLLKRQDATLKDLTEMTDTANEARIFSKRG